MGTKNYILGVLKYICHHEARGCFENELGRARVFNKKDGSKAWGGGRCAVTNGGARGRGPEHCTRRRTQRLPALPLSPLLGARATQSGVVALAPFPPHEHPARAAHPSVGASALLRGWRLATKVVDSTRPIVPVLDLSPAAAVGILCHRRWGCNAARYQCLPSAACGGRCSWPLCCTSVASFSPCYPFHPPLLLASQVPPWLLQ